MITIDDLDRVLGWMLRDGLQSIDVNQGDSHIRLKLAGMTAGSPARRREVPVSAKAIGRFLPAHPRSGTPDLKPGDRVKLGEIVGFIQNDTVLLPIVADTAGEVAQVHAEAGRLLGYGAPVLTLFSEH
jgi:acetyl-CoA carboxylase biotin carboxyl carrier protein